MSTPSKRTVPRCGRTVPEITLNSVVLPAPLGPTSPTISPAATESETLVERAQAAELDADVAQLKHRGIPRPHASGPTGTRFANNDSRPSGANRIMAPSSAPSTIWWPIGMTSLNRS